MDQTTDLNGQELHRILSVYQLPDFVKNASQADICGGGDLPPHLYADMTRRNFPIHTGPATVISSIFFNEKKAEINKHQAKFIEEKLDKAAEYFKVEGYCRRLSEKAAAVQEHSDEMLPDSAFAIVFESGNDKERRYPMRNAREVKAAAAWLHDHRDALPFEDRRKVADKVLEKSAEFGAGIPEYRDMLEKTAGLGVCAGKEAAKLIRTRILAAGNTRNPSPVQVELEKLAQLCEDSPRSIHHFGSLTKIATVIDMFDREHGLHRRYGDVIKRPEDVLFAVTEKVAADLDDSIVGSPLTGNYYKKADLQRLPVADFADYLGHDFADAVSTAGAWVDIGKLANIVPTLPLGDAELFDEAVSGMGVSPFATKSAAVGRALTDVDQVKMAQQHTPRPGSLWDHIS